MQEAEPASTMRQRGGKAPVRPAGVRSLAAFLATPAARRCSQVFVIRTSNDSRREFEAMFRAGVAMRPDDPDVQALAAVGHRIVMPDGGADRDRLGAMELRRGSVPGGWGTKLLGWCIPVGQTLFILMLASARSADLPGPAPDQACNAFTEAVCAVVRELRPQRLYAPLLNRLCRNVDFGGQVLRCLREHGVEVWVEGRRLDFSGGEGQLRGLLETYFAARDASGTVDRLAGVEASIYAAGDWYVTTKFLPFTWRSRVVAATDQLTGEATQRVPDVRDIEVTPNSVPIFDDFVEMLCQRHRTLDQIGRALGDRGVKARNPANFDAPTTLTDLAQPAAAVAALIQRRWLDAWLTGRYRTSIRLKADLRHSHPGLAERIASREGPHGRDEFWLDVDIPLPMPERGWWLTQQQYDQIVDARLAPTPQRLGRAAGSGARRPLASLSQWDDPAGGRQHRLATFDSSGSYQLLWRPLEQAYDEHGRSLGWTPQHRALKLATVTAAALHASIGQQLVALAGLLEGHAAPLSLPRRPADAGSAELLRADAAREALARLDARLKGIRRDRQEARGRGDRDEVAALERDRAEAQAERAAAQAELEHAEQAAAPAATPSPATVEADLGTLELVGVALMRCGTFAPASLNEALGHLLRDSLRVVPDPGALSVTWTATVTVPLAGGGEGTHRITSAHPVPAIAYSQRRSGPGPNWADRLAAAYFDDGRDLRDVARERGIDGSSRNDSHPVRQLRAWLREHGVVHPKRRLAAMDAPSEVRRVLGRVLRGHPPASDYEALVREAYTTDEPWGVCWAASTHDLSRALHAAVERLGGADIDPVEACQQAGLAWQDMILVTGRRRIAREGGENVLAGPALHRNWGSLDRGADRRLALFTCPHRDCLQRRRSGTAGVLIQLLVPELGPAGLLCRTCRRRPDHDRAVFPEVYLQPWRGGRRTRSGINGKERWVGSHLSTSTTSKGDLHDNAA